MNNEPLNKEAFIQQFVIAYVKTGNLNNLAYVIERAIAVYARIKEVTKE